MKQIFKITFGLHTELFPVVTTSQCVQVYKLMQVVSTGHQRWCTLPTWSDHMKTHLTDPGEQALELMCGNNQHWWERFTWVISVLTLSYKVQSAHPLHHPSLGHNFTFNGDSGQVCTHMYHKDTVTLLCVQYWRRGRWGGNTRGNMRTVLNGCHSAPAEVFGVSVTASWTLLKMKPYSSK